MNRVEVSRRYKFKFMQTVLYAWVLLLAGTCISIDAADQASPEYQNVKIRNLEHGSWQQVTTRLFSATQDRPSTCSARKVIYQYEERPYGKADYPVTAFVSQDKKIWIGPEQDFYVDTESGIVGGRLSGGFIIWSDSMVEKKELSSTNLDEAIKRFEEEKDVVALEAALNGYPREERKHLTDLRFAFDLWAFTNGRYSSMLSSNVKILGIEVLNGKLKMKLENKASQFDGEAWIDLKTKKLVKAFESGKKVSPRL